MQEIQTYIIKAAIFDLDGVIINSNPEIEKFWHRWAQQTSRKISAKEIKEHIHGRKGVETIAALFSNVSDEVKKQIIESAIVFDIQMEPGSIEGVIAFIKDLKASKVLIGLVTSSHKSRAVTMLAKHGLSESFNAFITAEDVQNGKPHPEPYIKMVEKLKIKAEECLVFEDAISGVMSAAKAGIKVLGINNKYAATDLLDAGAMAVINDFSFLKKNSSYFVPAGGNCRYQFVIT